MLSEIRSETWSSGRIEASIVFLCFWFVCVSFAVSRSYLKQMKVLEERCGCGCGCRRRPCRRHGCHRCALPMLLMLHILSMLPMLLRVVVVVVMVVMVEVVVVVVLVVVVGVLVVVVVLLLCHIVLLQFP